MNKMIVLIDDDLNAQIIAETLLRVRGLDVRTATDGSHAWELIRRHGATLLILGLVLPGMNGWEAMRRLCGRVEASPPQVRPRLLVTGSRTEPESERLARHLGADGFLHKPFDPRRFFETLEQLMTPRAPMLCNGMQSI